MSLDAFVRCNCVRDGKAQFHPFADRLIFDERGEPSLSGDVSEEDWEAHHRWLSKSCEHKGFLVGESLGNITLAKHLRDFLRGLQGNAAPRFPILLKKVLYDGTHTGDWIGSKEAVRLLQEVDTVLHSSDSLGIREELLHEHETSVRSQYRNRLSDRVLAFLVKVYLSASSSARRSRGRNDDRNPH